MCVASTPSPFNYQQAADLSAEQLLGIAQQGEKPAVTAATRCRALIHHAILHCILGRSSDVIPPPYN